MKPGSLLRVTGAFIVLRRDPTKRRPNRTDVTFQRDELLCVVARYRDPDPKKYWDLLLVVGPNGWIGGASVQYMQNSTAEVGPDRLPGD